VTKDIASLLSEQNTTVAVVGATDNPSKYGYVIYRDLKRKGYRVFAVNPGRATVDSDPAYADLRKLPEKPTIVNVVVPPAVAASVLKECLELDLLNVWLQPGAESPENLAFLQENGFNYLANACIMVESHVHPRR
jgi:predicted CoA-binding protein